MSREWQPHGSPPSWEEGAGQGPSATRVRNKVNFYCGRFVSWALLGVAYLMVDPSEGLSGDLVLGLLVPAIMSVGASVLLTRPFVEVQGDGLVVRNPLVRYEFKSSSARLITGEGRYARLRVGGRLIVVVALEESVSMQLRGSNPALDRLCTATEAHGATASTDDGSPLRVEMALFDRELWALAGTWALLIVFLAGRAASVT